MYIIDYRVGFIRNIREPEVHYLAPEVYMPVEIAPKDKRPGTYEYTFHLYDNRELVWTFSKDLLDGKVLTFQQLQDVFLFAHRVDKLAIMSVDRLLYVTKEFFERNYVKEER